MGHVEDFHVKEHPLELTFGYIWNQKMELFFCVYVCVCVHLPGICLLDQQALSHAKSFDELRCSIEIRHVQSL